MPFPTVIDISSLEGTSHKAKMEKLLSFSEDEELDVLYLIIRQDPEFFQAFDQKQFVETPLHLAAWEGRTQLTLEIQRLMPSFGKKLNPDGCSPLDLAMQGGHWETVAAMLRLNPELVRVQGREGFTPLHYAAQSGDVNALAFFLDCCPNSINELTAHWESAVHVAVKNEKLEAFRFLFAWLKWADKTTMLSWRDLKGNNVLHLAASTNQTEIMQLLIQYIPINIKNSQGSTALDMVNELRPDVNGEALQILQRKGAKSGSSISSDPASLAYYFRSPISIFDEIMKLELYLDIGLPAEIRNSILVVAVLIATTTYQAVLSPPGGVGNGNGIVSMANDDFRTFTLPNSIAFVASLAMILLFLPTRAYNIFLYMSLVFLMMSYTEAMTVISPPGSKTYTSIIMSTSYLILAMIVSVKCFIMVWRVRATRANNGYYLYRLMMLLHNTYSSARD